MNAENIGAFIPRFNLKNIKNRDIAGAIDNKLNTEKFKTASPTILAPRIVKKAAAPAISTNFSREKVSIIMPAFNAKDTIGEAIASALQGTHRNIEILVIDDGSTDGTDKIVTDMAGQDLPIKYYKNPKNLGAYNLEI
ncbi:MAG: glycosyltransferase family 2 protein [Microcoleus sp. PH2017_10_PVI_O_A]|uniref:glycosyltransferase family 2 protein n=1 Tax=unclassified Microcoleus TaxID=2642155 RepID=UPI001DCBC996|nr:MULTISPECIES: glycosyltransferase family 2 protein [unclassified Microcoleus]TAE84505.1 MAG: glycosyltransferase family 2 protein [Oscillatoriales cyanobacterium]MCC3405148.1 glycosyltransferase family 2 protein [Microcoleus sp. PH2017_10_PVI_O_A]MCC3459234.1 glycosyltransferase family 2 protein [Microcoleus sp. PH2017_11_PCY_U_A]MCC3477450.1 glycosyltransferase family 2 protein [Microcoleus sp. PH2017_12_PCY_D_A]MCC3528688.1 glycosyltransferase family 2 protein [Microcoleus sp. PH2017_21_R